MINVYIGYDPREAVAFNVLQTSIHDRATVPVSITPIRLSQLNDIFDRARGIRCSRRTLAFSRFLTPYLNEYRWIGRCSWTVTW